MKRWTAAAAAAVIVSGAACSSSEDARPQGSSEPKKVVVHGEERFPFDTLEEMRTFSDAWVRVSATGERFGEFEGEDPSEGYKPRFVTLVVEEVYWVRDGLDVPDEFEVPLGLTVSDGIEARMVFEGGTDIDVGGTYVVGLTNVDGEMNIRSPRAIRLLRNDVVQRAEIKDTTETELPEGADPEEFVAAVVNAEPLVPDSITDADDRLEVLFENES